MRDKKQIEAYHNMLKDLTLETGKVPPQAIDLEEAVLGAAMLQPEGVNILMVEIKTHEVFYKEAHQHIYLSIRNLFREHSAVDILLVQTELKKMGILEECGGPFFIMELTNKVSSAINSEYHCKIIIQKYLQREIIRIGSEGVKMGYEDTTDVFELIDGLITNLLNLNQTLVASNVRKISDVSKENMIRIKKIIDGEMGTTGIKSKLTLLDKVLGGFHAPDVIVIAGRPGMGKTALVISLVINISYIQKIPSALFSLEMSADQIDFRLKSQLININYRRLRDGDISQDQFSDLQKSAIETDDVPFYIDDTAGLSITDLRTKAIELVHNKGVRIIFVDYLQLMQGINRYGNRETEISTISREIKKLAKDLNIPIVPLSQLSRKCEERSDKTPLLSDLRESGAIEQDADIVIFTFRPSWYKLKDEMGLPIPSNQAILMIKKHRSGSTPDIPVNWDGSTMCYSDQMEVEVMNDEDELPF